VKIKRILFATKFEVMNLDALKSLLDLKSAGLEEILLTYVIPREKVAFVAYGGYLKEEAERLRAEARIRFEDWCDDLERAGVGAKVYIEVGDPVPEIMKLAEAEQVDLIVCGSTRRTGIEKIFAGSSTLELLRRARKIPVFVSKHMVVCEVAGECLRRRNEHPFQRPLFAADWSQPSERAVQFIAALKGLVSKVDLMHVEEVKIPRDQETAMWQRIEAESREHLHQFCEILAQMEIPSEPHLAAGDVVSEVLRLSGELNSTMIILGTTGKNRLHALFQGSPSQEVAEASDLPTLLIP